MIQELLKPIENKTYDNGIILVAAIGNNSTAVSFPASSPYVIGVSNWNESTNSLDSTSSYGIGTDFAIKGTNLTGYNKNGTLLTNITGTSFACPNLCGVIAELMAKDRTLKFEQIHNLLRVNSTYDSNIGWGVITSCPELPDTIPTEKELLESEANNEVSFEFNTYNVKTYDKLKINLVYSGDYKKTILKQLDETIVGVSTVNDGNLTGLLTGETYIYATDKFGIKNFSKVIVSNVIDSSYGENVEAERVTTERGFNFDEQNISAVLDSGIDGTGIKVGIMGYTITGAIADLKIKTIKNVTGSSNNSNDQKDINMISTITSSSFGYAPNCDLYYVEGGDASISWADAKTGINWFISNKVDVVVMYGNNSSDNDTLITNLNNAGIIVVAPYVAPSTNTTNPHISNKGVIHVGWVDPDKKVAKDMAFSALPPTSNYIDCVGYGYGIKSYNVETLDPYISTLADSGGTHFYLCLQACCQVVSILALMKQQYPAMNNTAKAKKLLPYICTSVGGYTTDKVGNGLIQAKLASDLNLEDDFFN